MLAVFKTGGKQYKAAIGDKLIVEKIACEVGKSFEFNEVLLINNGKNTVIGDPTVKGSSIKAKVIEQFKSEKILVFKKKKRHNYRRKNGHRQPLTRIEITEIKE